ncbi:hypothetical protein NDU88_004931, partial [Pleurodeles waltl]
VLKSMEKKEHFLLLRVLTELTINIDPSMDFLLKMHQPSVTCKDFRIVTGIIFLNRLATPPH